MLETRPQDCLFAPQIHIHLPAKHQICSNMRVRSGGHTSIALDSWKSFARKISPLYTNEVATHVNGYDLDVATVVAIARCVPSNFPYSR